MNEKHSDELSWTFRFILIAVSFFVFSWIIKFIGGSLIHAGFFTTIGFIAAGLAALSYLRGLSSKWVIKNKGNFYPASPKPD